MLINLLIIGLCYNCIAWQATECFNKYLSMPMEASLEIVNTEHIAISFTFCKVVYNLRHNSKGEYYNEEIEQLKEIKLMMNNETLLLKSMNGSATFDFVVLMPEPYLCKEFALPKKKISSIKVNHDAVFRNRNFHLFIHPANMIMIQEFVVQYPNSLFHSHNDGITNLKIESYDLTESRKIKCGAEVNFHNCKILKILEEFNRTMGCAYPIQKYYITNYLI